MKHIPGNKVHGANMGPIWGRQDQGGPHVGPMNFAIWDDFVTKPSSEPAQGARLILALWDMMKLR